jgi:hypothetical protein
VPYLLALMQERRDKHDDLEQKDFQCIFSPLRRFPAEVIALIFKHYPPRAFYSGSSTAILINGHWVLSQVCQKWRNIIKSWPNLWAKTVLRLPGCRNVTLPGMESLLRKGLELSKNQPLSLNLDLAGGGVSGNPQNFPSVFSILEPHFDRIQKLSITYNNATVPWLTALSQVFSSLEELCLAYIPLEVSLSQIPPMFLFRSLKLDTIRLSRSGNIGCTLDVRNRDLSTLCITDILKSCFDALTLTPHLQYLTLLDLSAFRDGCSTPGDLLKPTPPLPMLRVFHLRLTHAPLLDQLFLPSLEELVVSHDPSSENVPLHHNFLISILIRLFKRSSCPIRTLELFIPLIHKEMIINLFKVPCLVSLEDVYLRLGTFSNGILQRSETFDSPRVYSALFRSLTISDSTTSQTRGILPRLASFILEANSYVGKIPMMSGSNTYYGYRDKHYCVDIDLFDIHIMVQSRLRRNDGFVRLATLDIKFEFPAVNREIPTVHDTEGWLNGGLSFSTNMKRVKVKR